MNPDLRIIDNIKKRIEDNELNSNKDIDNNIIKEEKIDAIKDI